MARVERAAHQQQRRSRCAAQRASGEHSARLPTSLLRTSPVAGMWMRPAVTAAADLMQSSSSREHQRMTSCLPTEPRHGGRSFCTMPLAAQFYGRGLFGMAPVAWVGGPYPGVLGAVRRAAWGLPCLLSAALDQPLRSLSVGAFPRTPSHSIECRCCRFRGLHFLFRSNILFILFSLFSLFSFVKFYFRISWAAAHQSRWRATECGRTPPSPSPEPACPGASQAGSGRRQGKCRHRRPATTVRTPRRCGTSLRRRWGCPATRPPPEQRSGRRCRETEACLAPRAALLRRCVHSPRRSNASSPLPSHSITFRDPRPRLAAYFRARHCAAESFGDRINQSRREHASGASNYYFLSQPPEDDVAAHSQMYQASVTSMTTCGWSKRRHLWHHRNGTKPGFEGERGPGIVYFAMTSRTSSWTYR